MALARHMFSLYISYFLVVWLLLYAGVVVAIVVVGSLTVPKLSILDLTTMPPRYWLLGVGAVFPSAMLRVYIAHGVTRARLARGASTAALVVGSLLALIMAAAFATEHLIYRGNGWDLPVRGHLFESASSFGLVFGEFAVVYLVHFLAGWTIGLLFLRMDRMSAILLLVPAYLPAVLAEWVLGAGWPGLVWDGVFGERISAPWIALVACCVVIAGQTVLNERMTATVPVAAKSN